MPSDFLPTTSQVSQHRLDSTFVNDFDALCAHHQSYVTFLIGHVKLLFLNVWLKPPFVTTVGVRNGKTGSRPTTGYLTDVAHKNSQLGEVVWRVTVMTTF